MGKAGTNTNTGIFPYLGRLRCGVLTLAEHVLETACRISSCGGASSGGNLPTFPKENTSVVVYRER